MGLDFRSDFLAARTQFLQGSQDSPAPSFLDSAYGRMRDTGFLSANRWLVMVFPNQKVRDALGMSFVPDVARLATTCKSVSLNDRSWYTSEQSIGAGPNRLFPYQKNSSNSSGVRLSFNIGADMFEKEFFEAWYHHIQDPLTKQWKFYDDYAHDSEMLVLMLPNHVRNFSMAIEAMYQGKVTGIKFTEVYPYSININGGNLGYETNTSPMTVDISMMYLDMVPLKDIRLQYSNSIPAITDTGYPVIDSSWSKDAIDAAQASMDKAVNGFVTRGRLARKAFNEDRRRQMTILESYAKQLDQYKNDNFPRAVDGKVVYQTPRQGGLDLGLTLLSQTQGFFGAGFFGG
jgi:hypothetical protein